MEDVVNLEGSEDGKTYHPIRISDIGKGPQRIRFKLSMLPKINLDAFKSGALRVVVSECFDFGITSCPGGLSK